MQISKRKLKKSKGSITIIIITLWAMLFIILISSFLIEKYVLHLKAESISTSLLFSNLATYKNIDLKELGNTTPQLVINDAPKTLETFKTFLCENMYLDSNLFPKKNSMVINQVKIKDFIIYNINPIEKDKTYNVKIITFIPNSNSFSTSQNIVSKENLPKVNGKQLLNTCVFSTIIFDIEPLIKISKQPLHCTTSNITDIKFLK